MTPSGMINNASEYQFVTGQNIDAQHPHGDLDRIIIDGGIMPLRSSSSSASSTINWKNCLRGEDIAFLEEAACERLNATRSGYGQSYSGSFSREVRADAVNNTGFNIRLLFERSGNGYRDSAWIKDGQYPTSQAVFDVDSDESIHDNSAFLKAYQGYYFTLSDAQTPSNPVPDQDKVLRRSTIEAMFSDIGRLYYLSMWRTPHGDDYIFYNYGNRPEYSSSVAIEFPTNQYINRFENFGIGAFVVHYWKDNYGGMNKYVLIPMSLSSPLSPRDIAATAFSLIGVSDYEASGVISWVDGGVRGYFGELRSRTRWT